MNKETLVALQGSIDKWENIVNGKGVDSGWQNCPLCEKFMDEIGCFGCPVAKAGHPLCRNTPYTDWTNAAALTDDGDLILGSDESKHYAAAELRFLKSLLPKRKTKP